jgi:drug/metabolite transporter (DMT)-like permease|tara:strand:+ start:752 stop:1594 length:843 start_codon:yes stop_codon:yes gene_type:complete
MESDIFLLVIFAAILHAVWNGMVKNFGDKVISVSAIVFGHVPMAIVVMLFLPLPTLESVPYIILSAIIHQGYQYNLISAYKVGDLTKVYPIARGTGPIVATIISIIFLGLLITKFQALSVVLICFGIIILGMFSESSTKNNKAVIYSLATGFFIGMYSLADGHGARISLSPLSFLGWSFILNAIIFPFVLKYMGYSNIFSRVMKEAKLIFWIGGTLSYIVYGIVVWSFTKAPIPLVAALRESSIVFSILIGFFFLKERITFIKVLSILVIFVGVVLLKLF